MIIRMAAILLIVMSPLISSSRLLIGQIPNRLIYSDVPPNDGTIVSEVTDVCKGTPQRNIEAVQAIAAMRKAAGITEKIKKISYSATDSVSNTDSTLTMKEGWASKRKTGEQRKEAGEYSHRLLPYFEGWDANGRTELPSLYPPKNDDGNLTFDTTWKSRNPGLVVMSRITLDGSTYLPKKIVRITSSCALPQVQERYVRRYSHYEIVDGVQLPKQIYLEDGHKGSHLFNLSSITVGGADDK